MPGVPDTPAFNSSAADGVTTVFGFNFFVYSANDVKVYSVDDSLVLVPITTGITINVNDDGVGGTIVFTVPPLALVGDILRRREVAYDQTVTFNNLIRYKEQEIERGFNRLEMQIQQLMAAQYRAQSEEAARKAQAEAAARAMTTQFLGSNAAYSGGW